MKMLLRSKIWKIFSFCSIGLASNRLVFAQQIRVVATFPDFGGYYAADWQRAGECRESSHRG